MKYRKDEKTNNELSILGFGCLRFPKDAGQIDMTKTEELVTCAVEMGINYFDTAFIYPGSEDALGKIVKKHDLRDKINIATKLPYVQCKAYEDFDYYFEMQKKSLQTDYIDYYFIHGIGELAEWQYLCVLGIEKWLMGKKNSGEIRRVGFSFHGTCAEFLALIEAYEWEFCQIQYNYLNINYQAGVTGLKAAAAKGIPVFIMEPLLGGKLANGLPEKAIKLLKEKNSQWSPVAWGLNWLWSQSEVTMLLSGMNEMSQLEENVALANEAQAGMFSDEESKIIEKVIKIVVESYKIACTGCAYCMPCPKGIDIPACLSAYNSSYALDKYTGLRQYILNTGGLGKGKTHYASDCISCKKCERHCPQNIEISKEMKVVKKRMESFYLRPLLAMARKLPILTIARKVLAVARKVQGIGRRKK